MTFSFFPGNLKQHWNQNEGMGCTRSSVEDTGPWPHGATWGVCVGGAQGTLLSCGPCPSPHPCAKWDTHLTPPPSWDLWTPYPVGLISSRPAVRSGQLVTRMGRREGQGWSSTVLGGLAPPQPSQRDSGMWGTLKDALLCSAYPVVCPKPPSASCHQDDQQSCLRDLHPPFA